jgi:hypothetical protein
VFPADPDPAGGGGMNGFFHVASLPEKMNDGTSAGDASKKKI